MKEPDKNSLTPTFRSEIEGLRGVAILLVLLFHLNISKLGGGYIGVDVFFVLSGYLITKLLHSEHDLSGKIQLLKFYSRRALRLFPAAFIAILLTTAALFYVKGVFSFAEHTPYGVAAMLYISNINYAYDAAEYLKADIVTASPYLHTWSLGVEEQFYVIYPLLIILLMRAKSIKIQRVVLAGLALLSLALSTYLTKENEAAAFFLLPSRAAPLLVGALVALTPAWIGFKAVLATSLGLVVLVAESIVLSGKTPYPSVFIAGPTLATAAVLLGASADSLAKTLLSIPALRFIGKISYSLYLYHWPVIIFLAPLTAADWKAGTALTLIIAIVLAFLSWKYVEQPFLHLRTTLAPQKVLLASISISLCGALIVTQSANLISGDFNSLKPLPQKARKDLPIIYEDNCNKLGSQLPQCRYMTNILGAPTVVLLGDSHAAQWFSALEISAQKYGWNIISIVAGGCSFSDVTPLDIGDRIELCNARRISALNSVNEIQPDLVIIANVHSESATVAGTAKAFLSLHAPLALIVDNQALKEDGISCISRFGIGSGERGPKECWTLVEQRVKNGTFERSIANITSVARPTVVLDFNSLICPADVCTPILNGMVVYRDNWHLTDTFVRSIAEKFGSSLKSFLIKLSGE